MKERTMRLKAVRIAGLLSITAALAFGGAGVAQASHGADDPVGQHQEHANGERHHHDNGRHRGHHRHGHGRDDRPGHHRHGNEHGPNHR
jgi:hypothetical protein